MLRQSLKALLAIAVVVGAVLVVVALLPADDAALVDDQAPKQEEPTWEGLSYNTDLGYNHVLRCDAAGNVLVSVPPSSGEVVSAWFRVSQHSASDGDWSPMDRSAMGEYSGSTGRSMSAASTVDLRVVTALEDEAQKEWLWESISCDVPEGGNHAWYCDLGEDEPSVLMGCIGPLSEIARPAVGVISCGISNGSEAAESMHVVSDIRLARSPADIERGLDNVLVWYRERHDDGATGPWTAPRLLPSQFWWNSKWDGQTEA